MSFLQILNAEISYTVFCCLEENENATVVRRYQRRQGGMGGVSLGDKSSFLMFYWDEKNLVGICELAFNLYAIRRFLIGAF